MTLSSGAYTEGFAGSASRFTLPYTGQLDRVEFYGINRFQVTGTSKDDSIFTGSGNDMINSGAGNDFIDAGAGNDTINGGAGIDILIGGLGNDIYQVDTITDIITELAAQGTDTIQSSVAFNLATLANIENLTLTGTTSINGTGNTANNTLIGNTANNTLNGGAGIDTLTGGTGTDTFIFQFGQSLVANSDRITDFAIGTDKIDLLTQNGLAINAPTAFTRAVDSSATNLTTVVNNIFTDTNGAITGNQSLAINSAALVKVTTTGIAGTYLVVNDSTAGFQATNDLFVNITGFTGTIPALGTIAVNNLFV